MSISKSAQRETAFERVCIRHQLEGKVLSSHENMQHLSRLRDEYESALAFLDESQIPVCRVNAEKCTVEECTRRIVDYLEYYVRAGNERLTSIGAVKNSSQ